MRRRTILEGAGKISLVALLPVGAASAQKTTIPGGGGVGPDGHMGGDDCDGLPPERCRFNDYCHNVTCPDTCCECVCFH